MTRSGPRRLLVLTAPAVAAGALYGPTLQALDVLSFGETWTWREAAVRGAFFAVGMAVIAVIVRRQAEELLERAAVARVLSTGTLPEGSRPDEWVGRLRTARNRLRWDRVAAPGLSAVTAALVAAATVQPEGPARWGWLYVAVLLVAGIVLGIRQHRRMQTAERLLAESEERLAPA